MKKLKDQAERALDDLSGANIYNGHRDSLMVIDYIEALEARVSSLKNGEAQPTDEEREALEQALGFGEFRRIKP